MSTVEPSTGRMYVEPTLGRAFRLWVAWRWRWLLGTLVAMALLYVPNVFVGIVFGAHPITGFWTLIAGFVSVAAAQAYTLWNLFARRIGDFEMVLQEAGDGAAPGADLKLLDPSLKIAIRIWWAWFWRYFLTGVGVGVIAGFSALALGLVDPGPPPAPIF